VTEQLSKCTWYTWAEVLYVYTQPRPFTRSNTWDRVPETKDKLTKSQEESTRTGRRVSVIKRADFDVAIAVTAAVSGD